MTRREQLGLALDLVQGDGRVAAQELLRVASRRLPHIEVVQRPVAAISGKGLDQGALARLAGPRQHDRRHRGKPLLQGRGELAWKGIHAMYDNHSWHE